IFKLRPLPDCDWTILLSGDRASLLETIVALSRSKEVRPSALYLASGYERINNDIAVAVRFIDDEAAVAGQVHRLTDAIQSKVEAEELVVRAAGEFWDSIDDIDQTGGVALKISVPPVRMPAIVTEILDREFAGRAAADAVSGVVRLALNDPREAER